MTPEEDDPRFAPPPPASVEPAALEPAAPARRPPPRSAPYREVQAEAAPAPVAARLAGGSAAVLLAPLAVLLPARWRARVGLEQVPLRAGAAVEGLAQVGLALLWFYALVQAVHAQLVAPHAGELFEYIARGEDEAHLRALTATGMATWIYVALSWPGLACIYLLLEALVRVTAVAVSEEIVPSGPLALLDLGARRARRWWGERRLPPLVVDEVRRSAGGAHLEIASCRARDWPPGTVLVIDGTAWRVEASAAGDAARPFVYRLVRAPEGQVVRGRPVYRADEVLGMARGRRAL